MYNSPKIIVAIANNQFGLTGVSRYFYLTIDAPAGSVPTWSLSLSCEYFHGKRNVIESEITAIRDVDAVTAYRMARELVRQVRSGLSMDCNSEFQDHVYSSLTKAFASANLPVEIIAV